MSKLSVYAPYDGSLIRELDLMDEAQVFACMDTAHALFTKREAWLSVDERKDILLHLAALMKEQRLQLAMAAAQEGGKPLQDSKVEVDRAIIGVTWAAEHIDSQTGREIAMNITPSSAKRMAYTFREPVGVVLAISAFNHPINLIVHQVIPALAVGCPVIVKPASSTPLSCKKLLELLYQAGLPSQWCQMILCKAEVAERLVQDPRTAFLSFIGSSKVGWRLRSLLPEGATCTLEHGGAAPIVVDQDADLDELLPQLAKAGFYHAGQVCVSAQRVYFHEAIAEKAAVRLAELAEQLVVGDPTELETEVGPLISHEDVDRVEQWVTDAIAAGAKCLSGGKRLSAATYQPTVLLNADDDAKVSQDEIFGPVICCYSVKDREEAYQRANALPFSFQAAIFTQNIDAALEGVKKLDATAVMVNDMTTFRVDWMPFGGRKHSGLGMGGIPFSMTEMTYEKMMVIKSPVL